MLVAGPLIGLPLSFIVAPGALSRFSGLLPEAIQATAFILVGVGAGTFLLGTSLAALVSFFEFPGRRWIEWALVLPLAMPGYVFTLFALGLDVPGIRSTLGAVCVFTLVLYPYVYLLARAAFLSQSRTLIEAARGLGLSRRAGDPAGGPAARAAGDPRWRCARPDGGARRLRHGQPARGPDVHQRDLSRLVHRVRPRRGDAVRDAARLGHAHTARARAPRARALAPRPARGARRRRAAGAPARALGRGRRGAAARAGRACGAARRWLSSGCGRCSRSGTGCSRPSSPRPRATACCSPG